MRALNAESRVLTRWDPLHPGDYTIKFCRECFIRHAREHDSVEIDCSDADVVRSLTWSLNYGVQTKVTVTFAITEDEAQQRRRAIAARKRRIDHQMHPRPKPTSPSLLLDMRLPYKQVEIKSEGKSCKHPPSSSVFGDVDHENGVAKNLGSLGNAD